jgi:hypothetical protein
MNPGKLVPPAPADQASLAVHGLPQ